MIVDNDRTQCQTRAHEPKVPAVQSTVVDQESSIRRTNHHSIGTGFVVLHISTSATSIPYERLGANYPDEACPQDRV